ncbi:MFS transporter [Nocardia aurantia]|uniref:Putative multidrug resistance protein MdtD n=1 Tax=Nocardia aurantia TaxID=2585199 RepID=A0A7K0E1C0_9NOCA|nr:MFS transporter [Nocardia aurantia]MQY31795.1 putative multidrug resistance protein MdtD [Nocardia aurantia]
MALVKSRPHYNLVFAVLLAGVSAYALLQSMVVPVFSLLIPALHTTQSTATWLMTGYLLSASVATPILGRIGDKVGKERMLVCTLLALTVGSLIAALTESVSVMIVARVIQGLGGGVIPLAFGIIRDEFPARKLHGAVGIASSLLAVGSGVGLVLAGPIIDHLNYHWLFWIPMIMTALATVAAVLFVPASPVRSPGRINWFAALLLSAWLVALLLAVSEGPKWGWASPTTLGLFALAVITVAGWIVVELRSTTPLIDMRTMRIPAVWTTNVVAVLTGVGMYAMMTFLPQLLQTPRSVAGYGLSAGITRSGVYMLPLSVAMFIIGLSLGPLSARIGPKLIVLVGSILTVPAFALLALGHDHDWQIYLATALLGVGIGLSFSSMPAIIVAAVPPAQTGAATGMNANVRTVGGAIGSALSSVILTSGAHTAHGLPADSGYSNVFWFLGGVALLASFAAIAIPSVPALEPQSELVDTVAPEPLQAGLHAPVALHESAVHGHIRHAGGLPVTGVMLTLIDPHGHQIARAANTPDGAYRIDTPGPGDYVLIAAANGHQPVAVTVALGAHPQRVDLTLPDAGELSGTVRTAHTGDPVPNATVTLTNPHGEVVGTATTGPDGGFICRGVPSGTHTVVVTAAHLRPAATTVTVPESGLLRHDTTLEPLAVLGGVVHAAGRTVPDAHVTILDTTGNRIATARTDDEGRYEVPHLPAGDYVVVTRGYPTVTSNVRVAGTENVHDVQLGYEEARQPVR